MHFSAKIPKTASFCEKARKLIDLAKTMQLFRTNYHVLVFRWTFQPKVAKSGSIREGAQKFIDLAKTLQLFEQTTMSLHFDELFRRELQKVPHFVKKHGKSSIWPKLATFPTNYHVLTLWWTFQQKIAESASFSEKTLKIIDWAKTCNFFEQSTMFMRFDELFRQRLQKVPPFVKKHEHSSICQKLCNFFEQTTMFWCFNELFSQRLHKVAQFVREHENSSIWPKLCNFLNKLPCLCISMNFSGESCKKCLISWKSTKNHRFGQNLQLLEQTTMSWHFHELFSKEVQKVPFREKARQTIDLANTMQLFEQTTMFLHFDELLRKRLEKVVHLVKKHEKSWIWSKLATFRTNCHVFVFRWTFKEKVGKSGSFREKARKLMHFLKTCNFSKKLPCFDVSMNFSAKSASFREKTRKTIDLAKLCNFFEQTTMFWCFDELLRKRLQKVAQFVKKHEKSSIWPNLCNFSNKLPCLCISMNFSGKSCKKCLISWKSTKNYRFSQNFQLF